MEFTTTVRQKLLTKESGLTGFKVASESGKAKQSHTSESSLRIKLAATAFIIFQMATFTEVCFSMMSITV